jgi:adenylate cyclase
MALTGLLRSRRVSPFRLAVLITVLISLFYAFFSERLQILEFFELKTLDMRFRIRGRMQHDERVAIVVIDDHSIDNLGRWPWPRSYYADLLDVLSEDGARAIGIDVIFPEPEENPELYTLRKLKHYYDSRGLGTSSPEGKAFGDTLVQAMDVSDNDRLFADALERNDNAILALVFQSFGDVSAESPDDLGTAEGDMPPPELLSSEGVDYDTDDSFLTPGITGSAYKEFDKTADGELFEIPRAESILLPIDELSDAARDFGAINFFPDIDGSLRWENMAIEFMGRYYPPLGVQMVRHYRGLAARDIRIMQGEGLMVGDTLVPLDEKGRLLINYYGPTETFDYYSFSDVVDSALPPGTFRDRIVLLGEAATGLGDVWLTPFSQSLPGVEKHATVISNILQGNFLRKNRSIILIDFLFIAVTGFALGIVLPRLSPLRSSLFCLLALIVIVFLNYQIFSVLNIWANLMYPILTLLSVSIGVITFQFFTEEREKRRIKKAFKQYLNPALVEELAKKPESLRLGGEEKQLTVLFSDIRDFTTISEGMRPEQLVEMMNTYLSLMTGTIMENRGNVDKFIGDAIMAIFGAPLYFDDHPETSCLTALSMMRELRSHKPDWKGRGYPDINMGIGINTGRMVVGNMGSEDRFDYTVMGDSVNLASRLESLCKMYGVDIIISEFTASKIEGFTLRELDFVRVKGKDTAIRIYELVCHGPAGSEKEAELEEYSGALGLYRDRKWPDALERFSRLKEKTGNVLYVLYMKRCSEFIDNPPVDDWDMVFTLKRK